MNNDDQNATTKCAAGEYAAPSESKCEIRDDDQGTSSSLQTENDDPNTRKTGWYDDPSDNRFQRLWNSADKTWQPRTRIKPGCESMLTPEETIAHTEAVLRPGIAQNGNEATISKYPALAEWKTSVAFSILGLICGYVVLSACIYLGFPIVNLIMQLGVVQQLDFYLAKRLFMLCFSGPTIVFFVFADLYIFLYYFSFFGKVPKATSSKAISFWNFFFGDWLFGALWNTNLSKSKRTERPDHGISYMYFLILEGILLLGIAFA